MSELKRVMNSLFKTELSSQKIELALTDDIDKYLQKQNTVLKAADASWKDYQDYLTRADIPFKKMINLYNSLGNTISEADGLINKINSLSKELGLNPKDVKGYSAIFANLNTSKEILSTIASFKDPNTFQ
jgi:uncharacterized protein YdcH (DUF465 family)